MGGLLLIALQVFLINLLPRKKKKGENKIFKSSLAMSVCRGEKENKALNDVVEKTKQNKNQSTNTQHSLCIHEYTHTNSLVRHPNFVRQERLLLWSLLDQKINGVDKKKDLYNTTFHYYDTISPI